MFGIIGAMFSSLMTTSRELGGSFLKRQLVISEGKVAVAVARAQAMAQVQVTLATAEIEWEKSMASQAETSWKDELWTIFFVAILVASFVPGMDPYIATGFENISQLPDWFGYAVMLAISAAFGKNIVKDFTSLANNRKRPTTPPLELTSTNRIQK